MIQIHLKTFKIIIFIVARQKILHLSAEKGVFLTSNEIEVTF